MNQRRMTPTETPGVEANRDPITDAPGAHPVGTGLGAIGLGAVAGAGAGAIGGPVGAVVGSVVGAIAGGFAGKAVAESVNPTNEAAYWEANHQTRPYAHNSIGYDAYAPAYRYGWESYGRSADLDMTFESAETGLQSGWNQAKGTSALAWYQAKLASREAWNRVRHAARSNDGRKSD